MQNISQHVMKTTAQRLSEVYCRPKTEEEWGKFKMWNTNLLDAKELFPAIIEIGKTRQCIQRELSHDNLIGRTEISVQHFIDIIEDRIVPWRLEEDGFDVSILPYVKYVMSEFYERHSIQVTGKFVFLNGWAMKGIKTYTDLINQIKLIG